MEKNIGNQLDEHKANKGLRKKEQRAQRKTRKRKWIGHILEGNSLLGIVIERK